MLRDLAGVVHVFPHGTVTTLANMTREWSAYVLDVAVPYREDTDRVVEIPPPMPRSERGTVARSGDLTPK